MRSGSSQQNFLPLNGMVQHCSEGMSSGSSQQNFLPLNGMVQYCSEGMSSGSSQQNLLPLNKMVQHCSEGMRSDSSQQTFLPLNGLEPTIFQQGDGMGGVVKHCQPANSTQIPAPEDMCNYELPLTEPHTQLQNGLPMSGELYPAVVVDPEQKRTAADDVFTKAMIPPRELVPLPSEIPGQKPFLVNVKQHHRILKRRHARAQLLAETECKTLRTGKRYLHESRHQHALRRERGPKGRFVTKPKGKTAM